MQRHDQRSERNNQHEHHGDVEHLVVAACVAQPCAYCQKGKSGKQLVGGAEQRPDDGVAGHTEANAQNYGNEGCNVGVCQNLASTGGFVHGLTSGNPQLLEHVAAQAGCRVE